MAQYYSRGAWDLFVISALMRPLMRPRVRLGGAPVNLTFTEGALMGSRVLVAFAHALLIPLIALTDLTQRQPRVPRVSSL